MILVYTPGVWDLLHAGHVVYLERCKSLGDRLVVGVPDDLTVVADKGQAPVVPLEGRLRVLQSLRCVDVAVPYYQLEFLTHLIAFAPDVLAVGQDWGRDIRHRDAEDWVRANGRRMVRLPRHPGESTSDIRRRAARP